MESRVRFSAIGVLSWLAATAAAAPATTEARAMIVLDGSGSMWAPIGGKAKIEIAREALAELLRGWDPKVEVGLVAYGHRRKGDCSDIEVLAPAAALDAPLLRTLVKGIQPKGMTPLSAAVRQAAESLKFAERRATVILISDGIETCDADPCEVGAELEKLGVEFMVHVVGFGVERRDEGGLRCIAHATGGRYFAAADAAALVESLRAASREVVAAPAPAPPPVPATPPPSASLTAPASVTAGTVLSVGFTGPNGKGDYVGFAKPSDKDCSGNWIETAAGNPLPMRAPERPGAYELLYMQGTPRRPLARRAIQVTPARATLQAVETIMLGRTIEVAFTGPNGPGDFVTVVKPDAGNGDFGSYAYTAQGSPARIRVPDTPGTFELRYVTGSESEVLARRTVVALPAETSIEAPAKAPAGSTLKVGWIGPNNPGDFVTVVKPDAPKGSFGSYFYTADTAPAAATLVLPIVAGAYEIRYVTGQQSEVLARQAIELLPVTATLDAAASAPAGSTVPIRWTGPGYQGDYITVVEPSAPKNKFTNYFYTAATAPDAGVIVLPILAGAYELRYVTGQGDEVLARRAIQALPVAVTLEAPATAPAGSRLKVRWTGPNYQGDFITVVEPAAPKGTYLSYFYTKGTGPEDGVIELPNTAGSYEIRYVAGQGDEILARRKIELTAAAAR